MDEAQKRAKPLPKRAMMERLEAMALGEGADARMASAVLQRFAKSGKRAMRNNMIRQRLRNQLKTTKEIEVENNACIPG